MDGVDVDAMPLLSIDELSFLIIQKRKKVKVIGMFLRGQQNMHYCLFAGLNLGSR